MHTNDENGSTIKIHKNDEQKKKKKKMKKKTGEKIRKQNMGNATFFQLSSSCTRNNEDGNSNNNNDYDVDDEDNDMCSLSSKLIQFSFLKINSISNIITIIIIK